MITEELKALHWQTLKKMMEDAGLEYKSKEQAVDELSKLPAADGTVGTPPVGDTQPPAGNPKADGDTAPAPKAKPESPAVPHFNSKQPYGEISGSLPEAPGARFLQGGLYFNNAGDVVGKA